MLKVLHIIPSLLKGGAERIVLDMCNELQKNKELLVKIVCFSEQNEYKFLCDDLDIQVCKSIIIPSITGKHLVQIDNLLTLIKNFKPDIIHSHLFEAEIKSRWFIFPEVKYITHCHDNMKQFEVFNYKTLTDKSLLTNYYEKRIVIKRYLKCNNYFIAISKDTEDFFLKALPYSLKKNVLLLHNAIDIERFIEVFQINYVNKKKYTLVTAGRLVERKNQIFLIDVIRILKEKNYNIHLDILGDGSSRNIIQDRIRNLALENEITLHGNVNNIEDFFKDSFLYLHSAIYEPFGLVLLESMATGLPVICLDGKGNKDIIVEDNNGYLISKSDPNLFADKIIYLIENQEQYQKMRIFANNFAKGYNIKNYVNELIGIYQKITKK